MVAGWLAVVFLSVGAYFSGPAIGQSTDARPARLPGEVDQNWDDVFTTRQGWTGGDGGGTVDLGNGRVLWMFADSFIGGVADGKHAPGSHMINNVFAVQTVNDKSSPAPRVWDSAAISHPCPLLKASVNFCSPSTGIRCVMAP